MNTRARLFSALVCFMLASMPVFDASAGEAAPIDTSTCLVPAYRHDWEINEESGQVLLAFQLDAKGKVKSVKLVESSGWPDLDSASVRALKQCVFKAGATAIRNWETVRYTWVLK